MTSNIVLTICAICLTIVGGIIGAIGFILEKKAHIKLSEQNKQNLYIKDCLWLSGFFTYASGSILTGLALAFGPQSLLTPLRSVALISNTWLAHKYLNEPLTKRDMFSTIVIMFGCVLCIVFGPRTNEEELSVNINDLIHRFGNSKFWIFAVILTFLILIDWILIKFVLRKNVELHEQVRTNDENVELNEHFGTNDEDENENENDNISEQSVPIIHGSNFLMISYVSIAAYFGSWNVLLTKSVFEIIVSIFVSPKDAKLTFESWMTYILIIIFILVNVFQEYWKQKALKKFGALYVVPVYHVQIIIGGILFGAIYFGELNDLSLINVFLFLVSIIIVILGVSMLASVTGKKTISSVIFVCILCYFVLFHAIDIHE